MSHFIHFLVSHSQLLISVTFSLIVLLGGGYFLWSVLRPAKKEENIPQELFPHIQNIEEALKKVLEQGPSLSQSGGGSKKAENTEQSVSFAEESTKSTEEKESEEGTKSAEAQEAVQGESSGDDETSSEVKEASTSDSGEGADRAEQAGKLKEALESEIQKLKEEIKKRDEEIQKLKNAQPVEGDNKELEKKVQELEQKLMEYEIIEDDIADLSLYKEENARLKAELAKLKGESVEAPDQAEEEIEEKEEPKESASAAEAQEVEEPKDSASEEDKEEDGLLDEFKKALESDSEELDAPVQVEEKPLDEKEQGQVETETKADGDLPEEADDVLGDLIDTDKMLEEVANLQAAEGDASHVNIDEVNPDVDKMAEEAQSLGKGNQSD